MTKKLLFTLFSIFTLCHTELAQAQAVGAGEIYYELIGPKKYKVTAHIYRLCEQQPLTILVGTVYGNANTQVFFSFTRTAIQKINDTCNNPCKVQNAVSTPGFEKHTWEATVDFNNSAYNAFALNSICEVMFAVRMSGRGLSTTHGTGLYFLDAGTNICDTTIKSNHSPVFSMEPKFLAPCSQPLSYSPGPLDSMDHDSLSFELVAPQADYKKDIAYNSGYSYSIPITPYCPPNPNTTNCTPVPNAVPPRGFYFDNTTCQMVFTPSKCTDRGFIKFRINEFRRNPVTKKMVLVGYVTRDMALQIKSVNNNNPLTLTSSPSLFTICDNNIMMTAKTKDVTAVPFQTSADTTYMFWDKGFKGGIFNIVDTSREKSANITMKKDSSLQTINRQIFTVGAYDKRCNIALITKSFLAIDYPLTKYQLSKQINSCNVWNYSSSNPDTSQPDNIKTSVRILDPASKVIFTSVKNKDSYTFNTNGRHIIEYTFSNAPYACSKIVYDTVQISNAFFRGILSPANDTVVCAPYAAKIKFQPYKSPGMVQMQWYKNDTLYNSKDSMIQLTLSQDSRFRLKLTDNRGCLAESNITFTIKRHNALLDFPTTECKNTLTTYTAIINTLKAPITYKWNFNGKDTAITTRDLHFILKDTSLIRLTLKDSNNCVFSDSLYAYVIPSFTYKLSKDKQDICPDSLLRLTISNITAVPPFKLQWRISKNDSVMDDTTIVRRFKNRTAVLVHITDANTCQVTDSIVVNPIQIPDPVLPTFSKLCEGYQVDIKPIFVPNAYPKTFVWKLNNKEVNTTDSFYSFYIREASVVYVKSTNKLGCFSEDSTSIDIYERPTFNITGNTDYNQFNKVALNTDKAFPTYQWFNNVFTRDNSFWAYELGTPGKHTVWCNVTDVNGCNGGDTTDIYTDKFTGMEYITDSPVKLYPNPGRDILYIEVPDAYNMMFSNAEGKEIMSLQLHDGFNSVDIAGLAPGLYVIEIGNMHIRWMKE